MSKYSILRNPMTFGLVLSLFCQAAWFLIFIPVIKKPASSGTGSSIVFLGAILKDSDFSFKTGFLPGNFRNSRENFQNAFLSEKMAVLPDKPAAYLGQRPLVSKSVSSEAMAAVMSLLPQEISFGFADSSHFVSGVDFSDLKKNSLREDLRSMMAVDVFCGDGGRVVEVKKIMGSGDPLFDFYIMLKLKGATLKNFLTRNGFWVHIIFKIR